MTTPPMLRLRSIVLSIATLVTAAPGTAQQTRNRTPEANYRVARGKGDTLNAGVINATGVVYQATPTASTNFGPAGQYRIRWLGDSFGFQTSAAFRLDPAAALQPLFDASLAARPVAVLGTVDQTLRSLPNFPGGPTGSRRMVAARIPFQVYDVGGNSTEIVMFQRHTSGDVADSILLNSRLLGTGADTTRMHVPPDAWLPGDTLYVIARGTAGKFVALKLTLGCAANGATPPRITCNPLALGTRGATGYRPFAPGWESVWSVGDGAAPQRSR